MSTLVRTGEWLIYRFWDRAGHLLYIGQTSRAAMARWFEHMRDQPWAHEVATCQVDERIWYSEADVLEAERDAIHAERPRHNVAHNGTNPHRVVVRRPPRVPAVRRVARWRHTVRPKVAVLGALWLVLATALTGWLWLSTSSSTRPIQFGDAAMAGAIAPSVLYLAAMARPKRRRRRRR